MSADEREGDLRRILNFGHTVGHALEAETKYERFLHGEAVAFGMKAATELASIVGITQPIGSRSIRRTVDLYGPIPALSGIRPEALLSRLVSDKKTIQGKVHFVLPERIGHVRVMSGIPKTKHVLTAVRQPSHERSSPRGSATSERQPHGSAICSARLLLATIY